MKNLSATETISARMDLYRSIRNYFEQSDALEVEVPLLSKVGTTDPQIESFGVVGQSSRSYLQTSPEFFLKRLLSQTHQSCFCITKAFRDEEQGKNHNPEFSMLEWYRVEFDLDGIVEDCLELIQQCLNSPQHVFRETYSSLFQKHLNIDPHNIELEQLMPLVEKYTSYQGSCESVSEALQLLLSTAIEPTFTGLTLVRDFPVDQAALARLSKDLSGQLVAQRFEIYFDNIELANGYHELIDAGEQRSRFEQDNHKRRQMGRSEMMLDEALLDAMNVGLPDCSGVSIGLDRLLMARLGLDQIDDVLLFPWSQI